MMPSKAIPGRPDPDQIYRRFSARDWWKFLSELTDGAVLHQPEPQECPFCHAVDGLRIGTATGLRPPNFHCENCERAGDVLDFVAEYNGFVMEPRADALDLLGGWASDHDLPEVAVPKVIRLYAEPDAGDRRFELLRIKDFLNVPPVPALIANVLPAAQVSVLFGPSNSFKSFLAVDMLCSIATGRAWHGLPVEQGPVLYIVTEGAHEAVAKRIVGWFEDKGIDIEVGNTAIGIIKVPVIMNRVGDVDALIATIREGLPGCKLAVFDLLAGSMEGSEGDSEIVTAWVRGTQRLADELTCTQLHVTHSGYADATRGRGHSHLWGSFSTRLKAEGDADAKTTFLSVERHKDWDAAGLGWAFKLVQIPVGAGHETTLVPQLRHGKETSRKVWPVSANLLRAAIDAVADRGKSVQPFPDGPPVIGIPKAAVREEFYKSHTADHEDPKHRQTAKRMAWNRALEAARKANVIGNREIAGEDVLWLL